MMREKLESFYVFVPVIRVCGGREEGPGGREQGPSGKEEGLNGREGGGKFEGRTGECGWGKLLEFRRVGK